MNRFNAQDSTDSSLIEGAHCSCNIFKIPFCHFWTVYTQTYGGTGAIAPEHAAAIDYFFWSEKKGGSSAPFEPPLATCLLKEAQSFWLWYYFTRARAGLRSSAIAPQPFAPSVAGDRDLQTTLTQPVLCNIRNSCTCCMGRVLAPEKHDRAERAAIFFFFFLIGESRQTNARARRETKKQQGSP